MRGGLDAVHLGIVMPAPKWVIEKSLKIGCYVLTPEVDEKRGVSWDLQLGQVREQRVKSVLVEQAAWGKYYWLTGNQWGAAHLFTRCKVTGRIDGNAW